MPRRDDDPVHTQSDGLIFQATTDFRGVVAYPETSIGNLPISYMSVDQAVKVLGLMHNLRGGILELDPLHYLASYIGEIIDGLSAAIEACRPKA